MGPFLKGFVGELVKLGTGAGIGTPPLTGQGMNPPPPPPGNVGPSMGTGLGTFVKAPPKAAPTGSTAKGELEKRQAGGVNAALGDLGRAANKPAKTPAPKLDARPVKPPK